MKNDEYWMQQALDLACQARLAGEVPVGAVLVLNNECIGRGWNRPITDNDPTAHAEIITLRKGGQYLKNYRLCEASLYITLEPCIMCAGAIVHARLARVVFGASDPRYGAAGSVFNVLTSDRQNHRPQISGGVLEAQCSGILQEFFRQKRRAGQ
jgi:tRNA(adenine34) deaminase